MISDREDAMRDLERTQSVPMNRRTRRMLAKRVGVRFPVVNTKMVKQPPTYLGIKQFKKAANDPKLAAEYKQNAHDSLEELRSRRAAAQARAVKVTDEGKELTDDQMKELSK